ncbi:hypothetical protein TcasGA2_TC000897 [Tribolium castaneum]|uniref:Uncharacterized protein n=1 Tax=Tribolium castaneum TaxID=7070 RepID=D6W913_TRICA|nr:hypothetical protein TcasGA2_TC000897 [Tribolium castaneum]
MWPSAKQAIKQFVATVFIVLISSIDTRLAKFRKLTRNSLIGGHYGEKKRVEKVDILVGDPPYSPEIVRSEGRWSDPVIACLSIYYLSECRCVWQVSTASEF